MDKFQILGENPFSGVETNYLFEIMSAKTMLCLPETDKHEGLVEC